MYFISEALEFYLVAIGFGFILGFFLFVMKKVFSI